MSCSNQNSTKLSWQDDNVKAIDDSGKTQILSTQLKKISFGFENYKQIIT